MKHLALLVPLVALLGACASADADDAGLDAPGPLDLGGGDAGPRDAAHDAPSTDARADAHADGGRDLGFFLHDLGPVDLGRPCELWDAASPDMGELPDLGPTFDVADLGVAPDGDVGFCPMVAPTVGYAYGCPQYTFCTVPPDAGTGLTYDDFAEPLFLAYCTRCHSSTLTTLVARSNAPLGRNWDVRATVTTYLRQIRSAVGVSNFMPNDRPCLLPCDRRLELVRWIDEGAP